MNLLVLALGNYILSDDGAGPAVVRELHKVRLPADISLETTNLSGMALLDILTGYDTLIIIDAMQGDAKPGEIQWLRTGDINSWTGVSSQHNMNIVRMLEIGEALEYKVPADIRILAIGTQRANDFGESLSPEVAAVIPEAARMVLREIDEILKNKYGTEPWKTGEKPSV